MEPKQQPLIIDIRYNDRSSSFLGQNGLEKRFLPRPFHCTLVTATAPFPEAHLILTHLFLTGSWAHERGPPGRARRTSANLAGTSLLDRRGAGADRQLRDRSLGGLLCSVAVCSSGCSF